MCLDREKEFKIIRNYGYKIFIEKNGVLNYAYLDTQKAETNKWLTSNAYNLNIQSEYPLGFHIWATKEAALKDIKEFNLIFGMMWGTKYIMKKVLFKEVITTDKIF